MTTRIVLPSEADIDAMSKRQANEWLDALHEQHPETVEAVESATLIASPLAGPVRVLREVVAVLKEDTTAYPVEAVLLKHEASKTPAVLLVDTRHYEDMSRPGERFSVDIIEYEALGLYDTHAVFFTDYDAAHVFASQLAYLLGLSVEIIL